MKPPPLCKFQITITGQKQLVELGGSHILHQQPPLLTTTYHEQEQQRMDDDTHLKSVEGSVPCQPISFHCSDTSPGNVRSGNAACQRALRASCDAYKLLSFHTKANCTCITLSSPRLSNGNIPGALHETHQMAHLSAAADILVFPPARRLRYCQMCRMIMLNSQETKPLTLDGERS
jgi:hypothetical protein